METISIKICDNSAFQLLADMEAKHIIEVIKKTVVKEKKKLLSESLTADTRQTKNDSLRKKLLSGPVFTRNQIKEIEEVHNSITEWRTK